MRQHCEVCENFRPDAEGDPARPLVDVAFEGRVVRLCRGHALIAEKSGVSTFEQLREFYGTGRRSFVPRRAPDPTSSSPDRRRSAGRRATDARRD